MAEGTGEESPSLLFWLTPEQAVWSWRGCFAVLFGPSFGFPGIGLCDLEAFIEPLPCVLGSVFVTPSASRERFGTARPQGLKASLSRDSVSVI